MLTSEKMKYPMLNHMHSGIVATVVTFYAYSILSPKIGISIDYNIFMKFALCCSNSQRSRRSMLRNGFLVIEAQSRVPCPVKSALGGVGKEEGECMRNHFRYAHLPSMHRCVCVSARKWIKCLDFHKWRVHVSNIYLDMVYLILI